MNKFVKIGAIIVAVLLVLVVAVAILAKVLITPERVRSTVLPIAEDALGREVQLGDIEVSIFSGISLKDLAVKEKDGGENFVSADEVVLRYKFWPLFLLQVMVDEVRLEKPRIRVVRMEDGSFSFDDLAGEKTGAEKAESAQSQPADSGDGGGAPINLLVSTVRLNGGELLFIDRMINAEAPYRYQIDELDVTASDLSLDRAFPFEVSCRLNGAQLAVDGQADIGRQRGQASVELKDFDASGFSPYFRDQLPGTLGGLKIDLDLYAEGGMEKIASKGSVTLRELDLVLNDLKDAPLRDATIRLDYDMAADLAADRVDLASSRLDFNGIVAEASGTIASVTTQPNLDLNLLVPGLDLRQALKAVPAELVKDVKPFDPAGVVKVQAVLAGTLEEPIKLLRTAKITLEDVQATAGGQRPVIAGEIDIEGDRLNSRDLFMKIGDNRADIALQAENLFGTPIRVKNSVTSERFLIDPLLAGPAAAAAPADGTAGRAEQTSEGRAPAEEIGPFDIPVRAEGTVQIAEALYKGLSINNFDMAYRLVDNVFTIDKMAGEMAGGTFNSTARVDLRQKGLAYQTNIDVERFGADSFMQAFLPVARGTVFGDLSLDLAMQGKGTLVETIKRNISGKGEFALFDGRITGSGLVEGLSQFLSLDELKEIQVNKATGNIVIEQGRVKLNSSFTGDRVKASPQGSIGLDGGLDLSLNALLSPALAQKLDSKGQITSFLSNEEGWVQLPLKVAGTFTSPRFALDTSGVKEQVGQKAREEIEKKVFEKLLPGDGAKGEQDSGRKQLEDAVKGLFGR
ncbi:MAG: AsmA family protein [Thermodesulfobacteriota bacterium]|jgi:AsmA protein|nr:AsmA family protein [Thermodesulfobacteriota bacterium]